MTEHLRVSGAYWGMGALSLLGREHALDKEELVRLVLEAKHPEGGFAGHHGHDRHLLYTLSAIQLLCMLNSMDRLPAEHIVATSRWIGSLQRADGSFQGDEWGEVDTRFSYIALCTCALLGRLCDLDLPAAASFVARCGNFDGGFGAIPGAESHAGQIFCCVGALSIAGRLDLVDRELLTLWLRERQVSESGGLNGRPEKKPDVCYSWWVIASLAMLNVKPLLLSDGSSALERFILHCQDAETGGISDRPGDYPDVYHTFFGIAALGLLGLHNVLPVDPVYALPVKTLPHTFLSRNSNSSNIIIK